MPQMQGVTDGDLPHLATVTASCFWLVILAGTLAVDKSLFFPVVAVRARSGPAPIAAERGQNLSLLPHCLGFQIFLEWQADSFLKPLGK